MKSIISLFLFSIICFFLTRQVPFENYSYLSNIAVACLILLYFKQKYIYVASFLLLVPLGYSLIIGNNYYYAIRMYIILLSLIVAHYIKIPKIAISVFLAFCVIQCLFIIIISLSISIGYIDPNFALEYVSENDWGSVRPLFANIYIVQIVGSGIITFTYFLSYVSDIFPKKYLGLLRIVFLLAIIVAGNFAYQFSVFLFHLYFYIKSLRNKRGKITTNRLLLLLIFIISFGGIIFSYVSDTLERKSENSSPVRIEQVQVLMEDMVDSPGGPILGTGVGHIVNKRGKYRDYRDSAYFELQILYFLNQMGVAFFIYMIILYLLAKRHIGNKNLLTVYTFYFLYAATNPYMLDTTQFVVIIVLCNVVPHRFSYKYYKHECHRCPSSIQAR